MSIPKTLMKAHYQNTVDLSVISHNLSAILSEIIPKMNILVIKQCRCHVSIKKKIAIHIFSCFFLCEFTILDFELDKKRLNYITTVILLKSSVSKKKKKNAFLYSQQYDKS